MTPRRGIVGGAVASRLFYHPWRRRAIIAILAILFAILALFPERYRVAVTLTPTDPSSLGLGGALGQLGAFSSVFGNQAAVEIGLRVARSRDVRGIVIRKLDLVHRRNFANDVDADRWLTGAVDVRALRGGILQIETDQRDPKLGLDMISAFSEATRTRLAEISRTQTAYKRSILIDLVTDASDRLSRAQSAYDTFRRDTRYSAPGTAIEAIGERIPVLQAQLKAREVELRAARSFATDNNISVRQLIAQIQALNAQLVQAQSLNATDPNSVNRVVTQSTRVQKLQRELSIAQSLYDGYKRFLDGTSVEDLTSNGNVRILEPPFVDSARQINIVPAALCVLVILFGFAMEFYLLRPPLGSRRQDDGRMHV